MKSRVSVRPQHRHGPGCGGRATVAFAVSAVLVSTLAAPCTDASDLGSLKAGDEQRAGRTLGERETDAARRVAGTPSGVILTLREGVSVCLACRLVEGRSLDGLVPGSTLGGRLARHGASRARPLVPERPGSLVPLSAEAARARRAAAVRRFPARAARATDVADAVDFSRTYVVRLRRSPDLAALARELAEDPAVAHAEPDVVVRVALVPNDPFFSSSGTWGQAFDDLWGVKRVGAPAAWGTTRGAGVRVAVIDTGIDYGHPDIAANVWTNPGEIAGNGVDDDVNGYVDDVYGYDFADDDGDPLDDHGHGTHVAGTVAAVGDNGAGVVGVAYEAEVMAVRGLGRFGFGTVSDLAQAILYAVDMGADVINASWSGGFSQTIADAIASAHAAGVVFVAAAGNSAGDVSSTFPAADPNTIAVTAFDHLDGRASFSNFGEDVDVGAPGGGDLPPPAAKQFPSASILSLHSSAIAPAEDFDDKLILSQGGAEYLRIAGTSMAAPHVSAVAALVLADDPSLSVEQVRQLLRTTADDLEPVGFDVDSGFGLVNAAAAVAAPAPLEAHISSPSAAKLVGEVSVEILGSAGGPGFVSYAVQYRLEEEPDGWVSIEAPSATPVSAGLLATWNVAELADGRYVVRVIAERSGEQFVDTTTVRLSNVDISAPAPLAAIRSETTVDVVGTAAGGGFQSYLIEYRLPGIEPLTWITTGLTPQGPQSTLVRDGVLATLDVSDLTEGDRFDFRLTVTTDEGTFVKLRQGVVVDPTLHAGWPQQITPVADAEYLTVIDLDDDGLQEILVGSGDEIVVFQHDGSIRPGWPQSVATKAYPFVSTRGSPVVADIAGDESVEIIATNRNEILAWTADGELLEGFPVYVPAFDGLNDWIAAGDRDGDGKDDIVCTGVSGIGVYRGDGSEVHAGIHSDFGVAASAVSDVVSDVRVEIARRDRTLKFRGGLQKTGPVDLLGPDGAVIASRKARTQFFAHVSMADLDADGVLDVVTLREDKHKRKIRMNVLTADGGRLRMRAEKVGSGAELGESSGIVSYADTNDDGFVEAWTYMTTRRPSRFADHAGFFVAFQARGAPVKIAPLSNELFHSDRLGAVAVGDVDGDGAQELVAGVAGTGCGRDACRLWDGLFLPVRRGLVVQNLDGTLVDTFPKPLPQFFAEDADDTGVVVSIGLGVDDPRYNTPAIADLDGDGLKEIVFVDPGLAKIFVWDVDGTPGPLRADWPAYHGGSRHRNVFAPGSQ